MTKVQASLRFALASVNDAKRSYFGSQLASLRFGSQIVYGVIFVLFVLVTIFTTPPLTHYQLSHSDICKKICIIPVLSNLVISTIYKLKKK